MTAIFILFVVVQVIAPVLLILLFKWKGILGAFLFTAALHYTFRRIWVALDPNAANAYIAGPFTFVMLGLGLVYCLIAIAIAGAFIREEKPKT